MKRVLLTSLLVSILAWSAHADEAAYPSQPLAGEARHPSVDIVALLVMQKRQEAIEEQRKRAELDRQLLKLNGL